MKRKNTMLLALFFVFLAASTAMAAGPTKVSTKNGDFDLLISRIDDDKASCLIYGQLVNNTDKTYTSMVSFDIAFYDEEDNLLDVGGISFNNVPKRDTFPFKYRVAARITGYKRIELILKSTQ